MVALYLINSAVAALISCVLIGHNKPFKVNFKIWFTRSLYVFLPLTILGAIKQCNDMVAVKDKLDREYHERYQQSLMKKMMEEDQRRFEEAANSIMEHTKTIQKIDESRRRIEDDQRRLEEGRRSIDEKIKSMRKIGVTQ